MAGETAIFGEDKMFDHIEPSNVQLISLTDNTWSWAIWYGPGNNPPDLRDRNGTANSLSLAMSAVQTTLNAAFTQAFAYD